MKDENKALMRKMVEIFTTGDLSRVNSIIGNDYVDHQGLGEIDIRGPQGFSQVVRTARSDLPDLQVEIEDLIAEGDRVAVRLSWHGTRPDSKKIHRETIDIVRFENGQAAEHWGNRLWISESSPGGIIKK